MKLIKLLLKKIVRNKFSILIRNLIGFKPPIFLLNLNKKNISISDAFFWRTDQNYHTIFKFSDILNLFFKDNSSEVEMLFYDKNNNLIKCKKFSNIELSNKLIIDKTFLDGIEDHGIFYVFHKSKANINSIIRNSCYTGYSYKESLPSFVHGNLITSIRTFDGQNIEFGIVGASSLKKKLYKVQNFYDFDKTEVAIMNPTKNRLEIEINSNKFILESCCSKIINIDINNNKLIEIVSNCYLLRPIIFNYKKQFIDVYHG